MELKTGYKQTEVGVIPSDWEVKMLGDALKVRHGKRQHEVTDSNGEFPILASGGVIGQANTFLYDKPSVLIGRKGTIDKPQYMDTPFWTVDTLFYTEIFKKFDAKFVFYMFNLINWYAYNEASGVPSLNAKTIENIQRPFPETLAEQTAIATALSDTDQYITHLEKLIAKKRNIKQGAMQELLRAKEGWVVKKIFQLADCKKELFDDGDWIEAEHITDEGIRLIQTGNIGVGSYVEKDTRKYIFKHSFEKLGCKELQIGDLLICRLAEPAGRACVLPNIGEDKVITSVDVTIFRPRAEIANRIFLSYIFSTDLWLKAVSEMCGGTTHKRISRSALGKIEISVPNILEQNRIATILSDIDGEITTLETKLSKAQSIKQGMMQQLLTGKIRLI